MDGSARVLDRAFASLSCLLSLYHSILRWQGVRAVGWGWQYAIAEFDKMCVRSRRQGEYLRQIAGTVNHFIGYQDLNVSSPSYGKVRCTRRVL